MENQHKQITGYRDLTQGEIDAMNEAKALAEEVGLLVENLRADGDLDQRWVSIGATHLQEGFMALVRSIAKPTTF
jgi:hypothetical protein